MKTTKRESLDGLTGIVSSKKVGNNTFRIEYEDGRQSIRLHLTDVITFHPDGIIEFNSGGWKTVTTKDRMNNYQNSAYIFSNRGTWYLTLGGITWKVDKENDSVFYDGIRVDSKNGKIINPMKQDPQAELKKKIKKYLEHVSQHIRENGVPMPDAGDCWYCCMHEVKTGEPLGELTGNEDHLLSHLEEKYFHGSIALNALKYAGYRDPGFIFHLSNDRKDPDFVVRALRRYFKRYLHIP